MRVNEFISKLKRIRRDLVFVPGPNKASGLFLRQPWHEDANPIDGLRWIGACTSPSTFMGGMIEKDIFDTSGEYHRGWRHILRILHATGHFDGNAITRVFGGQWRQNRWTEVIDYRKGHAL